MVNIPTILVEKIEVKVRVNRGLYYLIQHMWLYHIYHN